MMPRLGRRPERNTTPPVDGVADKTAVMAPDSPGTPPLPAAATTGGNTIEDDAFFEHIPQLLQEVGEKLAKLLDVEAEAVQAAAALGPAASLQPPLPRESFMVPDLDQPEQVRSLRSGKQVFPVTVYTLTYIS